VENRNLPRRLNDLAVLHVTALAILNRMGERIDALTEPYGIRITDRSRRQLLVRRNKFVRQSRSAHKTGTAKSKTPQKLTCCYLHKNLLLAKPSAYGTGSLDRTKRMISQTGISSQNLHTISFTKAIATRRIYLFSINHLHNLSSYGENGICFEKF
jgi:hypothetical protein